MAKTDNKIYGDISTIKRSILELLEKIYDAKTDRKHFIGEEAASCMALASALINREVAVMIDRGGIIQSVSVGGNNTVDLYSGVPRRLSTRSSGMRCIHTHPNGDPRFSDVDISALKNMRLDAMAAFAIDGLGRVLAVNAAMYPPNGELAEYGPFYPWDMPQEAAPGAKATPEKPPSVPEELLEALDELFPIMLTQDANAEQVYFEPKEKPLERALLVGAQPRRGEAEPLGELAQLAWTAGAEVLGKILYRDREVDAAHYIGAGKLSEIKLLCQNNKAELVIFDEELNGVQVRNLEKELGIKVVDRTALILDIFAGRARTKEGKLQVELAQLNYNLTRLTGIGGQLSRLGGGIGTRGPGEKQLDVDRRHIRRRIYAIETELRKTRERRERTRNSGRISSMPVVAFVGYTNAGKSTLFNALCGAGVFTEDKLFATLDPTARKLDLPSGGGVIAIDTVGFIDKLPHELVDAFKATLEESVFADILLHVVDMSNPDAQAQIDVVERILHDIGAVGKKTLVAFNKADVVEEAPEWLAYWRDGASPTERMCVISAKTGQGLDGLKSELEKLAQEEYIRLNVLIPYNEGRICAYLHENASVLEEEYTDAGVSMDVMLGKGYAGWIRRFAV